MRIEEEGVEHSEGEATEEVRPDRPRGSIRDILAVIPPASSLKASQKQVREKRIRLKYDDSLAPEKAKINPRIANQLGITDKLEIVVAGRHRFAFLAILDEEVDEGHVHVNPDLMEEHGIADESIATVRAYKGTEKLGVKLNV
ncbi:MAG: hypothetical protein F7C38_07575 [Desulfurococcales archaeon]|nr:hypothetical protein [Desulfurococcales archaeon]